MNLLIYLVVFLSIFANITSAIAADFGDESAILTNQYFSYKPGDKQIRVHQEFDGKRNYKYLDAIGIEEVNGISCLRIIEVDTFNQWFSSLCLAQDSGGSIYIVEFFDTENGTPIVVNPPYPWIPDSPAVGDMLKGDEEVVEIGVTVPVLTTGLGPFTNCIKTVQDDGDSVYYAPGLSAVKKDDPTNPPVTAFELKETMYVIPGDVNGDSQIGLEEAINALNVSAGN